MKDYQRIGCYILLAGVIITGFSFGLSNCNNYDLNNSNLTSHSRSVNFFRITDKVEYTNLKDNSEEILLRKGSYIFRYQNFDGDDRIDRIRIDKYSTRDNFRLEKILNRDDDFLGNETEFEKADDILSQERNSF